MMLASGAAQAQVKLAYVGEISGQLAVSGGNFRDGVILAVEEINAKGGIAGKKIDLQLYDTQSNPSVARAQMQKALDGDVYAILGPVLSGNVKVTMQMLQQAEVPHLIGGEAADLVTLGDKFLFRTSFGQQIGMLRTFRPSRVRGTSPRTGSTSRPRMRTCSSSIRTKKNAPASCARRRSRA